MKVTVSVRGRFHAFDLARELARKNALERLITPYPRFVAERFGVPGDRVKSLLAVEVLARTWGRMPAWMRGRMDAQDALYRLFASRAVRHVPETADVLVAFSGSALASLRRAHELGQVAIVERGSAHVLEQRRILEEEHARLGMDRQIVHPGVVERELAEYAEADFIVVPSTFAEGSFVAEGVDPGKLLRVPYGVDAHVFRPGPEQPRGFRVVHCGLVSVQKGCHHLLAAFHALDVADKELLLVGAVQDEMRPFLERYAHPGLRVLGHRPQAELPDLYRRASVFVSASLQDGFGQTVLQAMACGLPVVVTEATGARDAVREERDGLGVPTGDVDALVAALERLARDPDARREYGLNARRTVEREYTWAHYGERAVAAYRRALGERVSLIAA